MKSRSTSSRYTSGDEYSHPGAWLASSRGRRRAAKSACFMGGLLYRRERGISQGDRLGSSSSWTYPTSTPFLPRCHGALRKPCHSDIRVGAREWSRSGGRIGVPAPSRPPFLGEPLERLLQDVIRVVRISIAEPPEFLD